MSAIIVQAKDGYVNGQLGLNFAANERQTLTFAKFRQLMADNPFNFDVVETIAHSRVLFADVSATATSIELDAPLSYLDDNDFWVVIGLYTAECEVRKVTSLAADAKTCTVAALDYAHSASDIVMLVDKPVVNVKWFGAKGDGSTDDGAACARAAEQARTQSLALYFPAGTYDTNATSLWCGRELTDAAGTGVKLIYGDGKERSIIRSNQLAGDAVVDWLGVHRKEIRSITISSEATSNKPSCGLLLGRIDVDSGAGVAPSAGWTYLHDMEITGGYSKSALYSYASEELSATRCEFRVNSGAIAAVILTDDNIDSVASGNVDISGTTNTNAGQSSGGISFVQCGFQYQDGSDGAAEALVKCDGYSDVHFWRPYFAYESNSNVGIHVLESARHLSVQHALFHASGFTYHLYLDVNAGTGAYNVVYQNNRGSASTAHVYATGDTLVARDSILRTNLSDGVINLQGGTTDSVVLLGETVTVVGVFQGHLTIPSSGTMTITASSNRGVIFRPDTGVTKYGGLGVEIDDGGFVKLPTLTGEPSSPANGMLVFADGTSWNPGSGQGFYGRRAGSWRFLE